MSDPILVNISEILGRAKHINSEAGYWLFRTMTGDFYQEYTQGDFIAIGYNEITKSDLANLPVSQSMALESLKEMLKNRNDEGINASYAASQLLRFTRSLREGDFVIVPSEGAARVSFGIIEEGELYEETNGIHLAGRCPFIKRKKIKWCREQARNTLNPRLQLLFNSRHIITDASNYASYIDSIFNDFYIKNSDAHLVLGIKTHNQISTNEFFALNQLFYIANRFCMENGVEAGDAEIIMKIQMESPGSMRFNSTAMFKITVVAMLILAINGGGFHFTNGDVNVDLSTPGALKNISDFLDREVDREIKSSIKNTLDSLEIKSPKDLEVIIRLLSEQNAIRERY